MLCAVRGKSFSTLLVFTAIALAGCSRQAAKDPYSLTFVIESNPANLDPRYATDAQSQHIDGLLFSSLLERDEQMNLHGDLAESWTFPIPLPTSSIYAPEFASMTAARSPLPM